MKNSVTVFQLIIIIFLIFVPAFSQNVLTEFNVVRIKYNGGGDWYGNKTTFLNLFQKLNQATEITTAFREESAEISDEAFYNYPVAYIAGHGNIRFSDEEAKRLRTYLISGGFLWADDDYGMDVSFRAAMKKVFPELNFVELPFSHPIYKQYYDFPNGLPKIHEHAGGPPVGLGLIYQGKLVVYYSLNTDISDGCENEDIHHDPAEIRETALRMGVNILLYALMN